MTNGSSRSASPSTSIFGLLYPIFHHVNPIACAPGALSPEDLPHEQQQQVCFVQEMTENLE